MGFLKHVLRENKLSGAEEKALMKKIRDVAARIKKAVSKKGISAKIVLGGSAAKGTVVRGDFDCDLFIVFDEKYKGKNISDMLGMALKEFKPDRLKGSRDYFQFSHDSINYEAVPVLSVHNVNKVENVTDASPLHVEWIKKRLSRNPGLRDEIILTKVFLKASSLYGAESYIKGFSGHVVDILVTHYKSFINLLSAASEWKKGIVIDTESHHTDALSELNQSKLGPLILIDPVQPYRNAAASLSPENFDSFRMAAKKFLKMASREFFVKKDINPDKLKEQYSGKKLVVIETGHAAGKPDILGAKCLKVFEYLNDQLKMFDFRIVGKGWRFDKKKRSALMWFAFGKEPLEPVFIHEGPPIRIMEHAERFRKKYRTIFEKNKRLHARVKRRFVLPEKLIRHLVESEYVKTRIRNVHFNVFC